MIRVTQCTFSDGHDETKYKVLYVDKLKIFPFWVKFLELFSRYPGNCICVCYHSCRGAPCSNTSLQPGSTATVRLCDPSEFLWNLPWLPSRAGTYPAFICPRWALGMGGLRRWCGLWLREVSSVHGHQAAKRQEWHQDPYWPAQQWGRKTGTFTFLQ